MKPLLSGRRHLLGKSQGIGVRSRIYAVRDGLEVDDLDHFEVTRRRVFFDDVLLVTRHQARGIAVLVLSGAFAALFLLFALMMRSEEPAAGWVFAAVAVPFVLVFVLRLALPLQVVTVFGKRSKARVVYWFRGRRRAAEVFATVCAQVETAQARLREEAPEPP